MWIRIEKDNKIYYEFEKGNLKIIQGTKLLNPLDEFRFNKVYGLKQIHSSIIIQTGFEGEAIGDGIFTDKKDEFVYVKTADCLPCAFYDKKTNMFGILHLGWRGTYLKIISRFISKMFHEFQIEPERWEVVFGQCIKYKDYEIGNELKNLFKSSGLKGIIEEDKTYLDLISANLNILKEFNINSYYLFPEYEKEIFFSHRRGEKGRNIFGGIII